MNEIKFIEFKPTPNEKHIGIATVLYDSKIYLRYKISPGKSGGYYPNCASYKVTDDEGNEGYIPAFLIESNMLKEQIESCVKSNIKKFLNPGSASIADSRSYQTTNVGIEPEYKDQDIPF